MVMLILQQLTSYYFTRCCQYRTMNTLMNTFVFLNTQDSSDSLVVRAVDYNWGVLGSKSTAVGSYLLPNTIYTTYKLWLVHADGQQQHILFKYATGNR